MHGADFYPMELSAEDLSFCDRIMSSEALAAIVLHGLATGKGGSIVRMADGEKAIIDASLGKPLRRFLQDDEWLAKYGVKDADLTELGNQLIWAGNNATHLAISISGLYLEGYNLQQYFTERKRFIDQFYHRIWYDRGRLKSILSAAPCLVLHRDPDMIVEKLTQNYELTNIEGVKVDSWHDHEKLMDTVEKSEARVVLVSAGPTGKAMIVNMAERRPDQFVIDVGGALHKVWCRQ